MPFVKDLVGISSMWLIFFIQLCSFDEGFPIYISCFKLGRLVNFSIVLVLGCSEVNVWFLIIINFHLNFYNKDFSTLT